MALKHVFFQSRAMRRIFDLASKWSRSSAPVFITGETGTGKEVVADFIHSRSVRANAPFIKLNCAALPLDLIESELFGSVKGAYTGSIGNRDGLFRAAENGTILLDELAEMPIQTQSKLLRVLQEKRVRPIGSNEFFNLTCRIMASTNIAPEEAIQEKKLRADLFHRLNVLTVHIPPLSERPEDICLLARHFLRMYSEEEGKPNLSFGEEIVCLLTLQPWQGNVRDLENAIRRAIISCEGEQLSIEDFQLGQKKVYEPALSGTLFDSGKKQMVIAALQKTNGRIQTAAKNLGIGRQTLYNYIAKYKISVHSLLDSKTFETEISDSELESSEPVDNEQLVSV